MTTWQFTPIALLYVVALLASIGVAAAAWRTRPARGAGLFALLSVATGIWTAGYLLGFFNTDLAWKLVMLRVEYLGIFATPYFWFMFALAYTHFERWVTRPLMVALAIVPVVGYILILFVNSHHLFYLSFGLVERAGLVVTQKEYGPAFWVLAGYSYLLIIGGVLILLFSIARYPQLYRGQILALGAAAAVPLISNFLYISGNNPLGFYDGSSLAFTITGVLILWAMGRYKLLDLPPVAHDLVFQNVTDAVVVLDSRVRVLAMNPMAERIVSRTQEQVIGRDVSEIFPEYQELIARYRDVMEIKDQITLGQGVDQRMYEMQIAPLQTRTGAISGRVILLHDITERENLIAELNAYASTVAHDLKSPLSTIFAYADFILSTPTIQLPASTTEHLSLIRSLSQKSTQIVEQLLTLARLRSTSEIKTEALAMQEIIAGVMVRLDHEVRASKATISPPKKWLTARGYGPWVEEIWSNYISNAIKHGGTPPVVRLGSERQGEMVRFWVQDNGRGIPPDQVSRLFVEFVRLDDSDDQEGHGLGLSIVARIVRRLGGQAGVENVNGGGSRFYLTQPAAAPGRKKK